MLIAMNLDMLTLEERAALIDRLQTQVRAANRLVASLRELVRKSKGRKLFDSIATIVERYDHAISTPARRARPKKLATKVLEAFDATYAEYEEYVKNRKNGEGAYYTYSGWLQHTLLPPTAVSIHDEIETFNDLASVSEVFKEHLRNLSRTGRSVDAIISLRRACFNISLIEAKHYVDRLRDNGPHPELEPLQRRSLMGEGGGLHFPPVSVPQADGDAGDEDDRRPDWREEDEVAANRHVS